VGDSLDTQGLYIQCGVWGIALQIFLYIGRCSNIFDLVISILVNSEQLRKRW